LKALLRCFPGPDLPDKKEFRNIRIAGFSRAKRHVFYVRGPFILRKEKQGIKDSRKLVVKSGKLNFS